jgi:hypothetical protein
VFITTEGCAPTHHPSRLTSKLRRYEVVTQALEAPWYLLVYDVTCGKGRRVSQTSLVACDDALVELLKTMDAADIRGIGRLDRCHCSGPSWGLKWIASVWKPGLGEARKVGPLLLRFGAESVVRDALLRPVEEVTGRRLVYEAGGLSADAPVLDCLVR